MGDELVRHLGESDLGDIELVLGDQREQQVERALEDVKVHLEPNSAAGLAGDVARSRAAHGSDVTGYGPQR